MKITIRVPYANCRKIPIWAHQEEEIDFRRDPAAADRCTLAFAALELKGHLEPTLTESVITFGSHSLDGESSDEPSASLEIRLEIAPGDLPPGSYQLNPGANRLAIVGVDRIGVLYGVYHLLKLQGWCWLEPGVVNETRPEPTDQLNLPSEPEAHQPGFELCRGFEFSFTSRESADLFLWMARNRLNLAGYRSLTGALGRKLGMLYKNGGHIFERILDPDRVLENGSTVWEQHPDWFGLPADGKKKKEEALRTQFCISQPDLLAFLAEELVTNIADRWSEADLVSVWGFDTWGSCCTCDQCRALGNDTDQYLFLLSRLRQGIDDARRSGRISHSVRMAGCAYEGTSTLCGPENRIPQNLIKAGDIIIFAPIDRSYAADLHDSDSGLNRPYAAALRSWLDRSDRLPIVICEYYNVSKYEDLPLLFNRRIANDLAAYRSQGVGGMTYMHFPLVNWAMRSLTHVLYAEFNWNPKSELDGLVASYLTNRYGPHGEAMAEVYALVESGYSRVGEWRNWHASILDALMHWDGATPDRPFAVANDLADAAGAIRNGEASLQALEQALKTVEELVQKEHVRDAENPDLSFRVAVNPVDYTGMKKGSPYALPLGEDRRLLRYGSDTMELMIEMVRYHDAMERGNREAADLAWQRIAIVADRMDTYWVPIKYEQPGPGLASPDALTRSQLRDLLARCRRHRARGRR